MKSKYFLALTVILIILFSLSTASAVGDVDDLSVDNNQATVDVDMSENANDSPEILTSDADSVDVSVEIDFENVYDGANYNTAGCEVPWTITAKATGGTAQNVKVHESLSGRIQILSATPSKGTFDIATGIWEIGELASSETATLSILTKVLENGRFVLTADATTDSADPDQSNNHDSLPIKSGEKKSGSNITETTTNRQEVPHNDHYKSNADSGFVERQIKKESTNTVSGKESSKKNGNSKIRSVNSYGDILYNAYGLLSNSVADIANSEEGASSQFVSGMPSNDYTKIPIFIFALFLIALVAIVGYDKVKT